MGQPTPPGDMPLIEGLGSEWNEFVSAIPEAQRAELGPKLKERINGYEERVKVYEPWEQFRKSGITPEHADVALRVFSTIENNPKEVYEAIGKSLGITAAEAKEVVKEVQTGKIDTTGEDPRLQTLQQQVDTLSQIALAQRNMTAEQTREKEAEAAIESDIAAVKKKYGNDVPEDQLIMRMYTKDMTAEEAYQDYSNFVSEVRKTRPAPMVMGAGGTVPNRAIDPRKLDSKETKNLVAQMLDHANAER
jgi:hypothetical protein